MLSYDNTHTHTHTHTHTRTRTHTHTHSTTKLTFLLSLVYTLNETGILHVTRAELLFATTLAAIFIRTAGHLLDVKDMLSGPAKLLWAMASALSPGPLEKTSKETRRGRHMKVD